MPLEAAQLGAGLEIPQPQRLIRGSRQRAPPVGQHRHAADPILMPLEAAQLGAGRREAWVEVEQARWRLRVAFSDPFQE